MRFAVLHKLSAPGAATRYLGRLVVEDVPDHTTRRQVLDLLSRAYDPVTKTSRAAAFTQAGIPFANHDVRAETARGWPRNTELAPDTPAVTWTELHNEVAAAERAIHRFALRTPQRVWDQVAKAAAIERRSLNDFINLAMEDRAAKILGSDSVPGPAPAPPADEAAAATQTGQPQTAQGGHRAADAATSNQNTGTQRRQQELMGMTKKALIPIYRHLPGVHQTTTELRTWSKPRLVQAILRQERTQQAAAAAEGSVKITV
jgi:hypothetical protein